MGTDMKATIPFRLLWVMIPRTDFPQWLKSCNYFKFLFAVESISLIRFNWLTSLAPGS